MTRAGFVQRLIVNAMCDDYENVDQVVLRDVASVAAGCGLTVDRGEVVENVRVLVEAGLVKAYRLSTREPFATELEGMPPVDIPEEDFSTYFYPTPKGLQWHESDRTCWPITENDVLRSDWDRTLGR